MDIECLICLEDMEDPGVLPCGHSFCQPCLGHLVAATSASAFSVPGLGFFLSSWEARVPCPVCRRADLRVSEPIPTNFALKCAAEQWKAHMGKATIAQQTDPPIPEEHSLEDNNIEEETSEEKENKLNIQTEDHEAATILAAKRSARVHRTMYIDALKLDEKVWTPMLIRHFISVQSNFNVRDYKALAEQMGEKSAAELAPFLATAFGQIQSSKELRNAFVLLTGMCTVGVWAGEVRRELATILASSPLYAAEFFVHRLLADILAASPSV